jgi:transcriptional regulator GlxA family with amidase domain
MELGMQQKTMAILALQGVQMLDVSGPLDVFAEANRQHGRDLYRSLVIGTSRRPIASSSGVQILPDRVVGSASEDRIDTLLVAGTPNIATTVFSAGLVAPVQAIWFGLQRSTAAGQDGPARWAARHHPLGGG